VVCPQSWARLLLQLSSKALAEQLLSHSFYQQHGFTARVIACHNSTGNRVLKNYPTQIGLAILAMAVGGFAIGTGEFVIMGLLPDVARGLTTSITRAGDAISSYALGVVIGAPLIAVLAARCARQRLLMVLIGLFAVGNCLSAMVSDYYSFITIRFLTGLPHGAFFGVAALVAASMVAPKQRGKAVGQMMLGLTLATLIGVPVAAWVGHHLSWQLAFWFVGGCALLSLLMIWRYVPWVAGDRQAHPLRELGALRQPQVLLALITGATGFAGMFAVFSYITPTLIHQAGLTQSLIPWVMVAFGIGMVGGSMVGGKLADWNVDRAIKFSLSWIIMVMLLFYWLCTSRFWAFPATLLIGSAALLIPALQIRLMDVAGEAQTLAAALNHSALNLANALGALLGGLSIDLGFGWRSTVWVGIALAILGLGSHAWSRRYNDTER
jgi:MFS transporter, DHA1 family, inner membrane transport protein